MHKLTKAERLSVRRWMDELLISAAGREDDQPLSPSDEFRFSRIMEKLREMLRGTDGAKLLPVARALGALAGLPDAPLPLVPFPPGVPTFVEALTDGTNLRMTFALSDGWFVVVKRFSAAAGVTSVKFWRSDYHATKAFWRTQTPVAPTLSMVDEARGAIAAAIAAYRTS